MAVRFNGAWFCGLVVMTCCWCYFSWIDDDGMLLQEKISWEKDFVAITAALKEANG